MFISVKVKEYTDGIPNNHRKRCSSKSAAMEYFKRHDDIGQAFVIDMGETNELDT